VIQIQPTVCDLIARAWTDESFMGRLLANPRAVMTEVGMNIPSGVNVVVLEDTPETIHFVLPAKPLSADMCEQDLANVVWGPAEAGHICIQCKAGE
jgi:hypothetical protein